MKNLYKCERCGKVSEDYEEIVKCENSHYVFNQPCYGDAGLADTLSSMTEYKEGQEEPNVIHIMFSKWVENENGQFEEKKRCGKYKLISSYEMPLVVTNE